MDGQTDGLISVTGLMKVIFIDIGCSCSEDRVRLAISTGCFNSRPTCYLLTARSDISKYVELISTTPACESAIGRGVGFNSSGTFVGVVVQVRFQMLPEGSRSHSLTVSRRVFQTARAA